MKNNRPLQDRYEKTEQFLIDHIDLASKILDLGITNSLSERLSGQGYKITNTAGEDLDFDNYLGNKYGTFDIVTAFEIFEHLVSPFELIRKLPANKLIATVPLRLWFAPAYRNEKDPWDRHFHEFEDWQFDWLLEKAGWEIKDRQKWVNKSGQIGIRPWLRNITPRYYAVYAERIL